MTPSGEVGETDGRRAKGRRTRESILDRAADLASVEGLEGLTIGRLATDLGMSKSGLFAHFGSKEELQLAAIEAAARRFAAHVVAPSRDLPPGRARLEAVFDGWMDYYRGNVFNGGCFFTTVWTEFESRPDGPVREALVAQKAGWHRFLEREIRKAQEAGDLDPEADPAQIEFELDAIGSVVNNAYQLMRDPTSFERARRAARARLDALAVRG
jgi:AcrR family transcriptional regulator